jgi:cytochrome c553
MKKIVFALSIIAALGLQATASDDLKASMTEMRNGLQEIQDGFSYNNKDGILKGIVKIEEANNLFHNKASAAKYLPEKKKKFARVAFISTRTLNTSLEQMKEFVEAGSLMAASESMSGVVKSCTRCHAIVRGW